MRKSGGIKIAFLMLLFCFGKANAQSQQTIEELGNLINDAIFFTDKYITPATDGAVYQAAAAWVNTPKVQKRWGFTLGVHFNTFLVPERDRSFLLSNSDLKFFTIDGATSADTPTALGSDQYVNLSGTLNNQPVTLRSPEGVNRQTIIYPDLHGTLGLGYGTELIARFSPKVNLKHVDYQVYGLGLKHSLSRYFSGMDQKGYHLSTAFFYSREDITVEFLDVETGYGNLGLNGLNSLINTWQLQFNASKEFKKLEISGGLIFDTSHFKYEVRGARGSVEDVIPLHNILNEKLKEIYKDKFNCIGEVSARYAMGDWFLQPNVAFGKFLNTNIALEYQF